MGIFQHLVRQNHFDEQVLAGGIEATEVTPSSSRTTSLLNRATEQVNLRIRYWTESRVGKAISSPFFGGDGSGVNGDGAAADF